MTGLRIVCPATETLSDDLFQWDEFEIESGMSDSTGMRISALRR
jgi:hypothetical protein